MSNNLSDPIEEVRVVRGDLTQVRSERSAAEEMRATILDTAEEKLRQGRDLIEEGLEMFAVVSTPQHRNLLTLIGQQIEQVIEFRRVRS